MRPEYYYHLQERIGQQNWYPIGSYKFYHPMEFVKVIDSYLATCRKDNKLVTDMNTNPLRIGVFSTEKQKRVDAIQLGTWRSLYQMYWMHGSVSKSVASSLQNAGANGAPPINIQV